MRTGSELIKATKRFAREDWRSGWHVWSTLAVLIALLGLTCLELPDPVRAAVSIVAGLVLVRMFVIYHDFQHGTILRGSRVTGAIMGIYGLFTLNPPSIWNRSHKHHHKHNSKAFGPGIGSFPLMTTESYAKANQMQRFGYAAVRHPLTILFGYFTIFLYGMCLRSLLADPRQHYDSGIAILLFAILVVVLAIAAPSILLFTLLLPCTIAGALGAYLFYAQHNFPGLKLQERGDWNVVFAALNSSSYITMNPVMRWFTANVGYHHVHHLNANIPFYRLPEAMAAIEELQSPRRTSLSPLDIFRCLRLKLWNPETNHLVPFKGH